MSLSDGERSILQFEEMWWKGAGTKEAAIRRRFGISASAYYRRLAILVDSPDALASSPLLVRRLRRRRLSRIKNRFEGAVAPGHPAR